MALVWQPQEVAYSQLCQLLSEFQKPGANQGLVRGAEAFDRELHTRYSTSEADLDESQHSKRPAAAQHSGTVTTTIQGADHDTPTSMLNARLSALVWSISSCRDLHEGLPVQLPSSIDSCPVLCVCRSCSNLIRQSTCLISTTIYRSYSPRVITYRSRCGIGSAA